MISDSTFYFKKTLLYCSVYRPGGLFNFTCEFFEIDTVFRNKFWADEDKKNCYLEKR